MKFERPVFTEVSSEEAIDNYELVPPGSFLGVRFSYPHDETRRLRQVHRVPALEGNRGELVRRLALITKDAQLVVVYENQTQELINYLLQTNTYLTEAAL